MTDTQMLMERVASSREDNASELYRLPPHNTAAEQMLLGAILSNNEALTRIGDFLRAEHFFEPVHQRIFESIQACTEKGIVATPVTLRNYFESDEALAAVGGAHYLVQLASMVTSIVDVRDHAKVLYDLSLRRSLIETGEEIVNTAFNVEVTSTAEQQIEKAEHSLFSLASEGASGGGFQALHHSLVGALAQTEHAYQHKERVSGTSTGFEDLNKLLGGFQNSDLLILAGRPSMGKTALAINMALQSCKFLVKDYEKQKQSGASDLPDKPPSVGFFSLEMSSEQLAARMLSMQAKVNAAQLRSGHLTEQDFSQIVQANQEMHALPFFIDDTPALTISAVRTRARRMKRKHNLGLLFIDYLQLVRGVSKHSSDSRVQEISEITQGLKAIAKELNIPVIALSQLSRAVEQREDKRPQLSDLRESGSIEQDSDIVMFIYRGEYYLSRKKPPEHKPQEMEKWQEEMNSVMNMADVIVAKHRNGPIGNVQLFFNPDITFFDDLETTHVPMG